MGKGRRWELVGRSRLLWADPGLFPVPLSLDSCLPGCDLLHRPPPMTSWYLETMHQIKYPSLEAVLGYFSHSKVKVTPMTSFNKLNQRHRDQILVSQARFLTNSMQEEGVNQ